MNTQKTFLPEGVKCSFLYNRTLDITDEQAHDADHAEKILFYIPNDTLVEEQVRDVNLADALIEFSSSFDTGSVLRTVTSDKYTHHFCKWEDDTWFCMVLDRTAYIDSKHVSHSSSFSTNIVLDVMEGLYKVYRMFYNAIEPSIYKKNEEGEIIAKELIRQRVKLHKAKYIEECVKNGEMQESEENKQYIDGISTYEERIKQLESMSELPIIRQQLFKVLRKYLLYYCWTQLHFLYSMDGFLEFPVDQSLSIDIHTMMSQLSIQLPFIQYSCLMFDNYFIWSDMSVENQILINRFCTSNRDLSPIENDRFRLIMNTEGEIETVVNLNVPNEENQITLTPFKLIRVRTGYCVFLFLLSNDFDTSSDIFLNDIVRLVGNKIQAINLELIKKRRTLIHLNDSSFMFFNHDELTHGLQTNASNQWIEGRPAISLVSPSFMMRNIPTFLVFPLNNVYMKLKTTSSFIEVTEKICDTYWLYGCKQKEHILLMMIKTPQIMTVEEILSAVHRMVDEKFGTAFNII